MSEPNERVELHDRGRYPHEHVVSRGSIHGVRHEDHWCQTYDVDPLEFGYRHNVLPAPGSPGHGALHRCPTNGALDEDCFDA